MLTAYRRPGNLAKQVEAVLNQTIKPKTIWLLHNCSPGVKVKRHEAIERGISISPNLGVWPRFPLCQEFETEYVCVFDDDTIPGKRWLENCYTSMQEKEGLYGTNGVIFPENGRRPYRGAGWKKGGRHDHSTEVDIVGHSWFFKRDWLRHYAFIPRPEHSEGHFRTCGEDYHFSFVMQQALRLATYVPKHPKGQMEWWGSIEGELGRDKHALYSKKPEERKKNMVHQLYRKAGWVLVCEGGRDASLARSEVHLPGSPAYWKSLIGPVFDQAQQQIQAVEPSPDGAAAGAES